MRTNKLFFAMLILVAFVIACKHTKSSQKSGTKYTPEYTYTKNIKAIIDPACGTKCHRAEKQAGGIDLSNYEGVKKATLTGSLLPAIKHAPGVKMMPLNGPKMDTIFIEMIEDWAKNGAPE